MEGKKIHWKQVGYHWEMYLFIIPTLILISMFQYYPALSGVFHSFYRWNGADISEYVGLQNYSRLLHNTDFWRSFELAFTLGIWNIAKMIPALAVAVCIHRCRSELVSLTYRMLFVIPMVIPGLIIVLIWRSFFFEATSGYLNKFLFSTGFFDMLVWLDKTFSWGGIFVTGNSPAWLGDPSLIVSACIIWGFPWVGSFAVLTYIARLQGIPKDIYEAADVDGVSWWSKFTKIELPLITSSIKLLLVFVIIDTIKDAGMILALAGMEGGPGGNATVPALFMLRKAFIDQDMGFACAVGIILTIIVMSLQKMSNILTKWNDLKAWQKKTIQGTAFAAAVLILCSGHFKAVGLALGVASIPYSEIFMFFRKLGENLKSIFARAPEKTGEVRKAIPAQIEPHIKALNIVSDLFLRGMKHFTILFVLGMALLPLYLMVIVSIKDNAQFYFAPATLTNPMHWINWKIAYEMITPSLANSLVISITGTWLTLFVALCAAYFFARFKLPMSTFIWNAILIMMMMPAIANLIPLFRLLNDMNILNTLSALIIVGTSSGQIFAIFVLRSFVEDIPQDLFEAAEIDGANHFQQMRIIVIPLAGPILGTVGVMNFISQWNDFVMPLIIIRDHGKLPVMVQLLRLSGEYIKLWGPLMAGYALASIPIIILFIFTMKLFTKGLTEGAVKG
jgi:ABC-type glycerol-3-phosphate transport system permease component